MIDAYAVSNEYEQAARFARIEEERVRLDPNSTDEDRAVAKEVRKAAEGLAMMNDEDLQRRIAEFEREQAQQAALAAAEQSAKTYIDVPFKQKNEAKALGARWDRQEQSRYVPAGVDPAPFAKWAQGASTAAVEGRDAAQATQAPAGERAAAQDRQYLAVPFGEHQAAKAAGAQWDKPAKSWYVGPQGNMDRLQRWLPENVPTQQGPAMTPEEEFADALKSMGGQLDADPKMRHPIMDGKKHRMEAVGDKKGEKAIYYVGCFYPTPENRKSPQNPLQAWLSELCDGMLTAFEWSPS